MSRSSTRGPSQFVTLGSALLIACASAPGHAQTEAQWQARQIEASRQSEQIMRDANKHKGLLAQFQVMRYAYNNNRDPAFQIIFGQYLSWYQTFIGDYVDAATTFSIKQPAMSDDRPSPLNDPDYTAQPAVDAIAKLAKSHDVVFLNEAHNIPLTRTLTVQLLGKLRAEGFTYFAAETLYESDTGLQARGYPTKDSGFYTEEPICAEMVRTALKLGFKVIAYEAISDATGNAREAEQARNIYQQVFKHDPHARLVVDAGYAHIQKSGVFLGGSSMAEHLQKLVHIDSLSVEQTMLYPHSTASDDHPYYAPIMHQLRPTSPIVFVDKAGKPWSLRPGYDVSVFFPPQKIRDGRPIWLTLGGERKSFYVSGERCNRSYPCLVEAHYVDDAADAIPADRLVLDPIPLNAVPSDRISTGRRQPFSELYMRPGRYRVTYSDVQGIPLFEQNVDIPGSDTASSPGKPDSRGPAPAATVTTAAGP